MKRSIVLFSVVFMGRRPLPAVPDFTRDGRWSTHNVSVRKKIGGGDAHKQDTPQSTQSCNRCFLAYIQ
jgi:hypothetical protein